MRSEYGRGSYPVVNREPTQNVLPEKVPIRFAGELDIGRNGKRRDLYQKALDAFPLARLQKVRQLSWIEAYAKPDAIGEHLPTRWDHTLEVAALTEAILERNGFTEQEIKLGIVAALLHDIATPAFGDTTMKVDPHALDEEAHWRDVIGAEGFAFLEEQGMDSHAIDRIIVNGGVFGKVLDVADRISYVTSDLYWMDKLLDRDKHGSKGEALFATAASYPDFGRIYEDVAVDRKADDIYFTDPDRLGAFLHIRALLRSKFVDSPESFGRDFQAGKLIRHHLREGTITPDDLRRMGDIDVVEIFDSHNRYHRPLPVWHRGSVYQQLVSFAPSADRVDTAAAGGNNYDQDSLVENGTLLLGTYTHDGFKPATEYPVQDHSGQIVPFKEYDPEAAMVIEEMSAASSGTFRFYKQVHVYNIKHE